MYIWKSKKLKRTYLQSTTWLKKQFVDAPVLEVLFGNEGTDAAGQVEVAVPVHVQDGVESHPGRVEEVLGDGGWWGGGD